MTAAAVEMPRDGALRHGDEKKKSGSSRTLHPVRDASSVEMPREVSRSVRRKGASTRSENTGLSTAVSSTRTCTRLPLPSALASTVGAPPKTDDAKKRGAVAVVERVAAAPLDTEVEEAEAAGSRRLSEVRNVDIGHAKPGRRDTEQDRADYDPSLLALLMGLPQQKECDQQARWHDDEPPSPERQRKLSMMTAIPMCAAAAVSRRDRGREICSKVETWSEGSTVDGCG
eukprot:2106038-Prymnesium_polylepis.1